MDQSEEHHVHFSQDTDEIGHSRIIVKEKGLLSFEAHVGFLQIFHKYRIDLELPLKQCDNYIEDTKKANYTFVDSERNSCAKPSENISPSVANSDEGDGEVTKCVLSSCPEPLYKFDDAKPISMCVKNLEVHITDDALRLCIDFFAHKEKLLKEKVYLSGPNGLKLQLVVLARVLGKGKGTPMLRDGIKLIGVEIEDESEASDWQGFD